MLLHLWQKEAVYKQGIKCEQWPGFILYNTEESSQQIFSFSIRELNHICDKVQNTANETLILVCVALISFLVLRDVEE